MMAGPKRKEAAPCPACKGSNTAAWSTGRRKCYDCNKTYMVNMVRPPQPRLTDQCPNGCTTPPVRAGGGRPSARCPECGKVWYAGRHRKADDIADAPILVITAAVNDSPVHTKFLATLRRYCADRGGRLVIIPLRYKNPTRQGEGDGETWAPAVVPDLYDRRMKVCAGLQILADVKTQPTAVDPLSGLDTLTGTDCGIFGHTKVALRSIATRGHELPKLLLTTGAVTLPAYSDTKAGKKGEFHHVCGAVVVEQDGDQFHLRHIHAARDGTFIDIDTKWSPSGATDAPPAQALVLGDVHAERVDAGALAAAKEMQAVLRPKNLILHDVLDFGSASHHNGFWEKFARRLKGTDRVAEELRITASVIDGLHRRGQRTVLVSSNHNDHLARWLSDHRNGEDVQNAGIYHRAKAAVLTAIEKAGKVPNIFALVIGPMLEKPAVFLTDKESFTVAGIELAYHGDRGPNGARGSAKAFDRIGAKTIIGHSHSPAIVGGCFQTGTTSQLDMGYNVGPSSWIHSHVVIYASGKRSHLHCVNGRWRRTTKRKK